jgi:hypothetical protein
MISTLKDLPACKKQAGLLQLPYSVAVSEISCFPASQATLPLMQLDITVSLLLKISADILKFERYGYVK